MTYVAGGDDLTLADRLSCFAHYHAVHDDVIARGKVAQCKFVFSGNLGRNFVALAINVDLFARRQIREGDQHVVSTVELQYAILYQRFRPGCLYRLRLRPATST